MSGNQCGTASSIRSRTRWISLDRDCHLAWTWMSETAAVVLACAFQQTLFSHDHVVGSGSLIRRQRLDIGHNNCQPFEGPLLGGHGLNLSGKSTAMANATCETVDLERKIEWPAGDNERASNEWIREQKNPEGACIAYTYVYTILICITRNYGPSQVWKQS
jgi:hypothetical protein